MLVTKSEVKRTSKKALSLLLALVMIMTSMSVCFGTFTVSAANIGSDFSGYTADAFEYLAEHLNGATVKKYTDRYNIGNTTNSGSANNTNNVTYVTDIKVDTYDEYCELRDILIYLDKAVKATECYQVGTADTNDEQTKSCVSAGDVEAEILDGMGGYATPSAAAKEFIAYVLEDTKAVQHSSASTSNKSPAKHTATLNVYTEDYKGYLEAHEGGNYSTVDASIEMGFTYSMYMKGGLYYSVKTTCGSDKYYHNAIWVNDYPINAPSSISGKANSSVKTTLTTYANYVDNFVATNTFDSMAVKSTEAIDALKKEIADKTTEIKNYIADAGEGKQDEIYNKLFPGYASKISTFNTNAEDAKAIALYSGVASDITAYQAANPNYGTFSWGAFDEATIKADYATFTSSYSSLLNNATVYNYFVSQNVFSDTYIKNFKDNVVAYDLEDLKEEKIDPLYETYKDTWADVDLEVKKDAYNKLSGYINNYNSYSTQVKDAIFTSGIAHLIDLQQKLKSEVDACVLYFAENVNKDYTDVSTEDLIKEVSTAKSNLAAAQNLKNSLSDANKALLDDTLADADTFIAYLYSLLADRYTAQVEIVDSTYTAIGRPTSNLTIAQYSQLNAYVNGIEQNIVNFLDAEGKGALVTSATRAKYAAIETELMPAFRAFEIDRGFNNYTAEDVLIRREDNSDEFFRQNADLDEDGVGEYEVTDENVNAIVDLLEELLKDETIKDLLGNLINKDENGNPTGEDFSLSGLITGLLEDVVYTDSLINTVVQFVYPLVLKEFAKVWAGLPPTITVNVPNVVGSLGADVNCGLGLDDVETAIASVGLYIAPSTLAANLTNVYGDKYEAAAKVLGSITQKAKYDKATDTFRNPWENVNLFEDVVDENGNPVIGDDGKVKQQYKLVWGVDEAEDKKAAFLDAAVAALSGLEPLLMAIISNKHFTNPDVTDGDVRGIRIGYGSGTATVSIVTVKVTIEPITLTLDFAENDGWDNALAPIFEAMGLTNIPHSEDLQTTRKLLENGLLAMIDQLITKLEANPIEFLLNALPNLAYALEGGLVEPLLHELKTVINYYADAYYDASLTTGTMKDAMKSEEPININIGEMINLKDMGLDISNFKAIWNMIAGGVELLANVEAPDAAYIASLGKLVEKDTNRSVKTYTAGTSGKAFHIEANRADVLQYLVTWVLESGLLSGLVEEPSELIATIFSNLENNSTDVVAAIVELLNQQKYPAKEYEWFDGSINGESVVGNSANEIYLNPNNDWTKEKAEYLYNNLDAILSAALTMAGVDFDLGATISGAVNGILTDKTLTALAALLAKLDLNALLEGDKETETVAEGDEAAAPAVELDVNALVKQYLGLDLAAIAAEYADIAAAVEADEEYVHNFGVDAGEKTFAEVLADMLAPLSVVLDFLLADGKLTLTVGAEKVELLGADGYNNAILPLLEALGCEIAEGDTTLEVIINTLVAKVNAIARGDVIKNIIDILPGALYFVASNGLATAVLNLLQPVLVIVDTIRPVFDVMGLINTLEIGEEGKKTTIPALLGVEELDLKNINLDFILSVVTSLTDLDLAGLKDVIYDVCNDLATPYTSASTLIGKDGKKGAYNDEFSAADLITVVLSFVLEWVTVADNGAKIDEMLGTDGIVASLGKVFEDLDIEYGTPTWYYWFDSEEAFDAYINGEEALPNTLAALEYPNDWSEESAQYIADNLAGLVDMVIGLLEINGKKYESVSALLNDLVYGDFDLTIGEDENAITINYLFSDETINALIGMLNGVLANIDETLLGAGYLLDVDLVGLKNYTCEKEITTISEFVAELAYVLDTYAPTIVNLLFFGDDIRLAKKSDKTDTIVINGGLGYEKGLALILEALGCDVPAADEATTANILGALATRVEAILANPVNEVIDMLPNIVYFLNANGASVAVNNILAPVYGILDKLTVFGIELDLAELLGFDLKYLSLADILDLVESKTGLDLEAAEEILVGLCIGDIEKADYTYKMVADRKDTITVILTTALMLVSDKDFAAKLDEVLGTDVISAIKTVFESAPVEYATPEWEYAVADNDTLDIIDYAITYPNNWTEETAQYVANLLVSDEFDALVAGLIDSNYTSLSDLLGDKVNIYTPDTLAAIQKLLGDLIGGLDADLKDLVNVGLGAADALLGADVQGLLDYDVSGVKDKETFVAALTGMLMEVEGLVDWLLLGEDYKFFVDTAKNDIITINGGHGYANGLALILEALGCEDLPTVYDKEVIDTEATVKAVLTSVANRIDKIFANPVVEVLNLLPNIIYFLNANGVSVAINNLIGAINALLIKLEGFGLEVNINELVNLKEILGVETEIGLDNLTMATLLAVAGELTGLNLAAIEDVLVGFALGEINVYTSVSAIGGTAKMEYKDEFDKHDLITVVATLALITVADKDNADVLRGLLGDKIYDLILNLLNVADPTIQEFDWQFKDKADTDYVFSAIDGSELYEGHQYGPNFTPEMAQNMADNFGEFVDNVIYLVGIQINGENVNSLKDLINGLLNGSVYNSKNVVAIRDALAGVLANVTDLEVNGVNVGKYIVEVLNKAGVADLTAVAKVEVGEFTEDREAFVNALCDVLAPLYNVLKYVLADKDLSFFVNGVKSDAIVLKGAEGYAYGIIPLLEVLECENILTPDEYYAEVEKDGSVLLTSILNPLLDRVDEIVNGDPAQEILDMLPNLIYFINSNGVDTVVKNTLAAVYALLSAIEPIAKIDLYEIIGLDLATIDFAWLFNKLLEIVADKTGYVFEDLDANAVAELTVGKLEAYKSLNGETAYRMVYADGATGGKAEMATVVSRLIITFVMHENNQEMLLGLLKDTFGMSDTTATYVGAVLSAIAKSSVETQLGMDTALALVYAVYSGAEIGADHASTGIKDLNKEWTGLLKDMQNSTDSGEALAGDILAGILDLDIFDDIVDPEEGIAPNGLVKFFTKISEFFKGIAEFFKNLFSFGK
jgi:hypothetical protein